MTNTELWKHNNTFDVRSYLTIEGQDIPYYMICAYSSYSLIHKDNPDIIIQIDVSVKGLGIFVVIVIR